MKPLLPLLAFTLLAACVHTVPAPPEPAPGRWTEAQGTARPDWAGLLDPQLAELQAEALRANRDLAQAALRLQLARNQAEQGGLRWQPTASLSTSANRPIQSQSSTRTVDVGGVSVPVTTSVGTSHSYSASLGVGYELDLWDRLAHGRAQLAAQAEQARTDVDAARLLLRSRVAESYWTLGAIAAQRPLAERQLQLAREILPLVKLRVQEGKLLPLELDKAAGNVQAAQSRLADLDTDLAQQQRQLALLLGRPVERQSVSAQLPEGPPPAWQLGEPAEVLARRPDVQHARLAVDAALAKARAGEAARYPQLSFSAGLSAGGTRASDWLAQPIANLAANLTVPLIDWQRLALQREAHRSELELAALALRDTLDKALVEIDNQRSDLQRLALQLDANASRLHESVETERQAQLRLEVGSLARADALQLQSARLEAEQGRIQLRLRQWLAQAALFKALGGA